MKSAISTLSLDSSIQCPAEQSNSPPTQMHPSHDLVRARNICTGRIAEQHMPCNAPQVPNCMHMISRKCVYVNPIQIEAQCEHLPRVRPTRIHIRVNCSASQLSHPALFAIITCVCDRVISCIQCNLVHHPGV